MFLSLFLHISPILYKLKDVFLNMSYLSELTITFRKTLITGWTWTFFGILKTHIIAIHMLLISTFHPSLNVVYCCIMNCHATNFVHIWIPFWMVIFSSFICEFKMLFTGLGNQSFKMNTLKLVQLVKSRILPNYIVPQYNYNT